QKTAHAIAVSALRFFLLKFTRNTIIAFDFEDALSFEGETGPYCLYAVVRIRGIRRKGAEGGDRTVSPEVAAKYLNDAQSADFWELLLPAGIPPPPGDPATPAQEPPFAPKSASQLAQTFNNFYHNPHIPSEPDLKNRVFLWALPKLVKRQLV